MAQRIITFTSGAKILSETAPARIIQTGSTLAVLGASVTSVNGETGAVVLDATDVGAEAGLGVPATTGYVLTSTTGGVRSWVPQTGGGGAVDSVNGKTGVVVLTTTDIGSAPVTHASTHGTTGADAVSPSSIGAELAGAAASAVAGHNLAYDHTHIATAYSHAGTTGNPHNTTAAQVGALVTTDLTAHTNLTTGAHGGVVASTDSRLTDSRTPTAHASTHGTTGADAVYPSSIGATKALTVTALKTSNYTANASEYVPCDISAGSFAVTLPTAPADKTVIQILIVKTGSTSYLTINSGGTDKFNRTDGPQAIYMYLAIESLACQYQSSTGIWFLQSAAGTFNFATGNPGIDAMNPISASEISIDTTTGSPTERVLTITPTRGYLDFFVDGGGKISRMRKTGTVAFPAFTDTSGSWFFYFNSTGTAVTTHIPWTVSDFSTIAPVYRIEWNSSLTGAAKLVSQYVEYHTNSITHDDHAWQHLQGSVWASGYTLAHNAKTTGSPDDDGRNSVIGLTSGTVRDENLPYTVANSTGGAIWQQDMGDTTPASLNATNSGQFKVFIQDSSALLSFIAASRFPFSFSVGNVPEYITAAGVRTPVNSTNFFVYFVYSTQNPISGDAVKVISATSDFTNITNARSYTWASIQAAYSIIGNDNEIRPLYRLIFEYRSSYNVGAKSAALREAMDIRKAAVATVSVAAGSVPASSVTVVPAGHIASTNVQSVLEELDSEKVASGGALGTPTTGTLTNCTGLPIGGIVATGTPSLSTFLRGDSSWAIPSGGGNLSTTGTPTTGQLAQFTGSTTVQGLTPGSGVVTALGYDVGSAGGIDTIDCTATLINKTINDKSNSIDANGLHIVGFNNTGSTITKGQAVYVDSFFDDGSMPYLVLAKADNPGTMPCLGLAEANILGASSGEVRTAGLITGVNTSAFSSGDLLYVSATTAGAFQNTRPTTNAQLVGKVGRSNATTGTIDIYREPVASNYTGTGSYVRDTSPTLVTPSIGTPTTGTLTNCTGLPEGGLTLADNTTNDASTSKHGFLKKLSNTATEFMNGAGNWATPSTTTTDMLIAAPGSDHTANGLRETVTVGENVVFGELLYCKSDGKWWKSDADAATTMPGLRLALATASADATCNSLVVGLAHDDSWNWTVGGLVYASTDVGALTQTAPSGTGDQVQVIGVAYHADYLFFNPSPVLVEVK